MTLLRTRRATFLGVLLLVLVPVAAGAEGENDEAAPPDSTTAGVVLEQPLEDVEIHYQGLRVGAVHHDGRYVLSFRNPGSEPRSLSVEIGCVSWSGSLFGRMGPMPSMVGRETHEVMVDGGATVRVALDRAWPALPLAPALEAAAPANLGAVVVSRVQLLLRAPGGPEIDAMALLGLTPDLVFVTPRAEGA